MTDIAPVVTRKLDNRPYPKDWERRARVVTALSERQLSLKGLAEKLEVTPGYLSSIIWGRRRLASAEHAIATALGYSWESLFAKKTGQRNPVRLEKILEIYQVSNRITTSEEYLAFFRKLGKR